MLPHIIGIIRPSSETSTATRSCRTRKRAFYFYSPGVVRRSHSAVRHVLARGPVTHALTPPPPLLLLLGATDGSDAGV